MRCATTAVGCQKFATEPLCQTKERVVLKRARSSFEPTAPSQIEEREEIRVPLLAAGGATCQKAQPPSVRSVSTLPAAVQPNTTLDTLKQSQKSVLARYQQTILALRTQLSQLQQENAQLKNQIQQK